MRIIRLCVIVFLVTVLAACSATSPFLDQPPGMIVAIGDTRLEAVIEASNWDSRNGVITQQAAPPAVFATESLKPVTVPAGSVAKLNLALQPEAGTLVSQQWRPDYSRTDAEPVKDGELPLPTHPGIYTYSVSARWQQGKVTYAFQVEIR